MGVNAILRLIGDAEAINHNDFTIKLSRDGEEPFLIAHGNTDEAASNGVAHVIFEVVHEGYRGDQNIWSILWRPDDPGKYLAVASDGAT